MDEAKPGCVLGLGPVPGEWGQWEALLLQEFDKSVQRLLATRIAVYLMTFLIVTVAWAAHTRYSRPGPVLGRQPAGCAPSGHGFAWPKVRLVVGVLGWTAAPPGSPQRPLPHRCFHRHVATAARPRPG